MPRAQQLTQREIDARAKFGLGPKPAERAGDPGKIEQPEACPWNFDTAIEILRRQPDNLIMGVEMRACARARQNRRAPNEIAKMRARVRAWMHASVHGEIELICQMYRLECAIERQETEAAKAEAFQRAPRWHKHCQRALRQLREAEKLGDMVLARDAFAELRRYQLLPPAP